MAYLGDAYKRLVTALALGGYSVLFAYNKVSVLLSSGMSAIIYGLLFGSYLVRKDSHAFW